MLTGDSAPATRIAACLVGVLLMSLLVGEVGPVGGYKPSTSWWPSNSLHFQLANLIGTSAVYKSATQRTMAEWNAAGANFSFTHSSAVYDSISCGVSDNQVIAFDPEDGCGRFGNGALAVTSLRFKQFCFLFICGEKKYDVDITFNTNYQWGVFKGSRTGQYDFERVMLHELGHAVGLDHEDDGSDTIMNSHYDHGEYLYSDDVAGIQYIRGANGNKPDLQVRFSAAGGDQWPRPTTGSLSISPGDPLRLHADVVNAGNALSVPTTLRYYRSTNSIISTSDLAVYSSPVGNIVNGKSTSYTATTLSAPAGGGDYYYGACVRTLNDPPAEESNLNNNCSDPVRVTVVVPDLVVQLTSLSDSTLTPGQSFTFRSTVRNVGQGSALGTTLRYWARNASWSPIRWVSVGTQEVPSLAGGSPGRAYRPSFNAPQPGIYYYRACVDEDPRESNRANNCSGSVRVTVTAALPDRAALVALYNATNGASWTVKTNWNSHEPVAQWHGVTVRNGRVTALDLSQNNLVGRIPAEIGNLTALTELYLRDNRLASLPPELGNLTNLTVLEIFQSELTGRIPPELGNLHNLAVLEAFDNRLTGPIPPELGNLQSLTALDLDDNQLTGSIPDSLRNPTRLVGLDLSGNQLTGPIPPRLGYGSRSSLRVVNLGRNRLTGSIPVELGALRSLWGLGLHDNQLSGPLPSELGNLMQLEVLFVEDNQLSGPVPVELGRLANLRELALDSDTGLCLVQGFPLASRFAQLAQQEGVSSCSDAAGFTDDPIVPGVTAVKAAHFTELRTRIDVLRETHGLGRFRWTNPILAAGVRIRGVHMSELRTALQQTYAAANRTPGFITESVRPGWEIHAWHINDLRDAVKTLER